MKYVLLAVLLISTVALADSVPFVFQNNASTQVPLINNPSVTSTYGLSPKLGGTYLQFGMNMTTGYTGAVVMELTIDGKTSIASFDVNPSWCNGCVLAQGFNVARNLYHLTNFTFTVIEDGKVVFSGQGTYTAPVPEPGSLVLFGSGLVAVFFAIKKGGLIGRPYRLRSVTTSKPSQGE